MNGDSVNYWRAVDDRAARAFHRMRATSGRATLNLGDDTIPVQKWQIEGYPTELRNDAQRLQDMGLSTMPLPGAKVAVFYSGGQRSQGVVIAVDDPRYRPKGLKGGESHLYIVDEAKADGTGGKTQSVVKGLLGWVTHFLGKSINVGDESATAIKVGTTAKSVAIDVGSSNATTNITGKAGDVVVAGVSLVHHTHGDPGEGTTGPPTGSSGGSGGSGGAGGGSGGSGDGSGTGSGVGPSALIYIVWGSRDRAPRDGELLFNHAAAGVEFLMPEELSGSAGGIDLLGIAPAADAVFRLYREGVEIGQMLIPAGATPGANSARFTFPATVRFARDSHFRLVAPSPADVAMSRPFYSFGGTHT